MDNAGFELGEMLEVVSPDEEMSALVDQYLDGGLDERGKAELEQRLEAEEQAQNYFVSRLRFHGELLESQQPLRVEMIQKRQVVFEYDKGIPKVTTREAQATRVGNPTRDKFVELVPENTSMRRLLIGLGVMLIIAFGFILFLATRPLPDPTAVEPLSEVLSFRNGGFEDTDLAGDDDGKSYSTLEWQDHFRSRNVRITDVARLLPQKQAAEGNNAVFVPPGSFLTQRLLFSDNSPLRASKGMRLRISGMAMLYSRSGDPREISIALRVVEGIHPEMLQYQPCKREFMVSQHDWQPFEVVLELPVDSLVMSPSDGRMEIRKKMGAKDLEGKPLTVSIDNRSKGIVLLDDLKIEVMTTVDKQKKK